LKQLEPEQQVSRKPGVVQALTAFNHLVELETINKPIAVAALGFLFSIEVFRLGFDPFRYFGGLLSIGLILCYVMAINDCFDVEDDKLKSKCTYKKLIVSVEISTRDALLISTIMLLIGLTISLFVSLWSFFVALLIVGLSTPYSVPPIRYKQRFPFSTMGEIAGSLLPFFFGYAILGVIDYKALAVAPFFALTQVFWRLIHERRCRDIDLLTGKKTVAIVYGEEVAKVVSRICLILAVSMVLILYYFGWISLWFLVFLGLFYIFSFEFWAYFRKYTPKAVYRIIGPTWGVVFVMMLVLFLVLPK
jgi:4-hydroxybenzoate polyprenyltransferase